LKTTAKKYNNIKLIVSVSKAVLSFTLLFLFIALGYSRFLEAEIQKIISNSYLILITFTLILGFISAIIFFPINYYVEYYLEHKYNLSNQTFWKWIWENSKGVMVGLVIGLPLLLMFYFVLIYFGELWWLPFGVLMFIVSVVLARVVPILILPIFYKVTPIENDELKERIILHSKSAGIKVENVFKFDMSKNTKKANAAFTGIGKSKRILLGDTLLSNFSNDEIETVIAHELGHYKKKHILINIIISTLISFITFYTISVLYSNTLFVFKFESIYQIAALPLLVLWASLIGLIITPISNIISRKFEYQADLYAIESTKKHTAFISTLEKLTEQNLGDSQPHPLIEWFFYSHPSLTKRIVHIKLHQNQFQK
jgi:STE24 endopeptidase